MTVKPTMSAEEEPSAHKRTASSTSALPSPPPAKRTPNNLLPNRRTFPHAAALVFYRDGEDSTSSTSVLGVYADLADANDKVRKLAEEQGSPLEASRNDLEPVRWSAPDGAACWVEVHVVTPKKIVKREVSPKEEPVKKLYDSEEGEDPDVEEEEGGHYD
ncbi:hypothetical protein C8034_v008746 [Colletotrichum sidae]|uniref:Uncharacterized protein n=1 Tax=Colletotrichum sidae TaxID=1347389 RepID=A0A4R8TNJ8_9PEZI|nr:hypothetical protein C8034_v008746 [Colletotrichum sidae]